MIQNNFQCSNGTFHTMLIILPQESVLFFRCPHVSVYPKDNGSRCEQYSVLVPVVQEKPVGHEVVKRYPFRSVMSPVFLFFLFALTESNNYKKKLLDVCIFTHRDTEKVNEFTVNIFTAKNRGSVINPKVKDTTKLYKSQVYCIILSLVFALKCDYTSNVMNVDIVFPFVQVKG